MHCHINRLMLTTSVVWLKVYICSINLTIYRHIVLYFTFHLVLFIVIYFAGSYSYATCANRLYSYATCTKYVCLAMSY